MNKLNKSLLITLGIVGALTVGFFLGPKDSLGAVPPLPDFSGLSPSEVEATILSSEAAINGLREDAQKSIVWFDPQAKDKTPVCLVFLHGYTASRREFDPAPQLLARAIGANLFLTRFAGHGYTGPDGHRGVKADMWAADTAEAVAVGRALGEKVVLIGSSTGGTMAIYALAQPDWKVDAAILASPNFGPKDPLSEILSWPWSPLFTKLVVGDYRTFDSALPAHYQAWDVTHHTDSLLAMGAVVSQVRAMDPSLVKAPVMVLLHPQDTAVNPEMTKSLFERWGSSSKKLVLSNLQPPNSTHVLAGDLLAPDGTATLVEESIIFLSEAGILE